jgi:3-methyladenine DNA glycosylase AlkD
MTTEQLPNQPHARVPPQTPPPVSLPALRQALQAAATPGAAAILQRFFKTGPGEYAEGDRFHGVRVPALRKLVPSCDALGLDQLRTLLHAQYHEERLLALLALVRRFGRGDDALRCRIYTLYLRETRFINNWDLVDLSAPAIVGGWLLERDRSTLDELAASPVLWRRRIAVLATFTFIRHGDFADTLRLCQTLLSDPHDLMQKACGWMLREVGKRDRAVLLSFLGDHAERMPRTMLRYAIEHLPEPQRQSWLNRKPQ